MKKFFALVIALAVVLSASSSFAAEKLNTARAGSTPLVVKAVKLSGACDVVVSDEDAEKILSANKATNMLASCAVVLVR